MKRILLVLLGVMVTGSVFAEPAPLWIRNVVTGMSLYNYDDVDPDYGTPLPDVRPILNISNSQILVQSTTRNEPYAGMRSPYVSLSSTTLPCSSLTSNTIAASNGDMLWCTGSQWIDITTTLGATIANVSSVSSSLYSYVLSNNAQISSLTTAVNSKVSTSTLNNYATNAALSSQVSSLTTALGNKVDVSVYNAGISSLTTTVNGKQSSLGTSNTTTYLRGDQTWQTLPTAIVPTFSAVIRTIGTSFQVSATSYAYLNYSIPVTCAAPLIVGQSGTTTLQYADNSGMSLNVRTVETASNSASGVLGLSNTGAGNVGGIVPASKWYRISSTGTCTVPSNVSGTEVSF